MTASDLTLASVAQRLEEHAPPGVASPDLASLLAREGRVHDAVASTIALTAARADAGAPAFAWDAAEEQTAGRGQHGRRWLTPRGSGLAVSVLLRPAQPATALPRLVTVAGLAAAEATRASSGLDVRVKQPNDLVIHSADGRWRKLGGVLVDTAVQGERVRHAVVSLGLNVALDPTELPESLTGLVTSLAAEAGRPIDRSDVLARFLVRLHDRTQAEDAGRSEEIDAAHAALVVEAPGLSLPLLPAGPRRAATPVPETSE